MMAINTHDIEPQSPTQRAEALLDTVAQQFNRLAAMIPGDSIDSSPEVTLVYHLILDPRIDNPSPPTLIPEEDSSGLGRFIGMTVHTVIIHRDLIGQCGLGVTINPIPVESFMDSIKNHDFSVSQPDVTIKHSFDGPTVNDCTPELAIDTDGALPGEEDILTKLQRIVSQVAAAPLVKLPRPN